MMMSNLGMQFYGRVTNFKTAEKVSKLFRKYDKVYTTTSRGNSQKSTDWFESTNTKTTSESIQQRDKIEAKEIVALRTGQFVGVNAEGNVRDFNEVFKFKNSSHYQLENFACLFISSPSTFSEKTCPLS